MSVRYYHREFVLPDHEQIEGGSRRGFERAQNARMAVEHIVSTILQHERGDLVLNWQWVEKPADLAGHFTARLSLEINE